MSLPTFVIFLLERMLLAPGRLVSSSGLKRSDPEPDFLPEVTTLFKSYPDK